MKKLITVTTDFGDSFATSQIKAVIYSLGFEGNIIENHDVSDFSITEAAFQLLTLANYCPKETIHICVVDPGVGSSRAGVVIQTRNFWFVGPDNGCLYPASFKDRIINAWKISEQAINKNIFKTFHGRDVFVRAGIFLSQNKHPDEFGSTSIDVNKLQTVLFKNGQVLHIDHYGNIKINWDGKIQVGRKLLLKLKNENLEVPVVATFSEVDLGKPLAYLGSSNTLELAINQGNAANTYSTQTGDILSISYM
jgi:S-adenosyl-L-methionine hydrolase (adenosine-forming)